MALNLGGARRFVSMCVWRLASKKRWGLFLLYLVYADDLHESDLSFWIDRVITLDELAFVRREWRL